MGTGKRLICMLFGRQPVAFNGAAAAAVGVPAPPLSGGTVGK